MKSIHSFSRIAGTLVLLVAGVAGLYAQMPGGGRPEGGGRPDGGARQGGGWNNPQMNVGRLYGKIIDDATGKGVGYASVQLIGMKFDTVSKTRKEAIIGGQLTEDNGEFSLENLPIFGEFTLKIVCIGYETYQQKTGFGLKPGGMGGNGGGARPDMSAMEKDLGNLRMKVSSQVLKEVTITENATFSLALDKKVFKVDKNNVAAGGTAEDALRNVPSLTVDIDGGVTLRNAAPQIFVDGRPTTLSLDQIPADAIDNVELITNPSAKYDASGGNAGIVNIVLKKERRVGYNGSIRAGIDMRGRPNIGGDINAREGKVNAFIGGMMNLRRSIGQGETDRDNLFGSPLTSIFQQSATQNDRRFINGRAGVDWFMSNRNTLTITGNYTQGQFESDDELKIHTDTLRSGTTTFSDAVRNSLSDREFKNIGGQILFKHLFPKEGKEWTADANYNGSRSKNIGNFTTDYADDRIDGKQKQEGSGVNDFLTLQTDFVSPLKNGIKLETGARAAFRSYSSENANFQFAPATNNFERIYNFTDRYKFYDQVLAAYGTFSQSFKKWGYQTGLRVESSRYEGTLLENNQKFVNEYPFSLFPSVFLTYKLNEEDNLQLNYGRRINRPNFFQLIPFPDFSDSLLLSRGNPNLRPEFTNSLEFSYQNIINRNHNFLISAYYKQSENLITRYQFTEFNDVIQREAVVSSFENAIGGYAYGMEFTLKNSLFKRLLDFTTNFNFYNSIVDATNVEPSLRNEQFTWFFKENISLRLPKQITFQANGEYQSRAAFASGGGGGGRGGGGHGGGGWMGGPTNTAQGYTKPVWFLDLSIRKDMWQRKGSITLSVEDIFRSRRRGTYTGSNFFTQDTWSRRDPQFVRLMFSYRFGKFDASLFKRKNTRFSTDGMEGGF